MPEFEKKKLPENVAASKSGSALGHLLDRVATSAIRKNKNYVHVQVDYKNAFNMLHRRWMRITFKKFCPNLLPFFDLVYGRHSDVFYSHDVVIKSKRGF